MCLPQSWFTLLVNAYTHLNASCNFPTTFKLKHITGNMQRAQYQNMTMDLILGVSRRMCHSVSCCHLLLLSVDTLLQLEVWCNWHLDKMNSLQVTHREGALMSQSVRLSQLQTWGGRERAVEAVVSLTLQPVSGCGDAVKWRLTNDGSQQSWFLIEQERERQSNCRTKHTILFIAQTRRMRCCVVMYQIVWPLWDSYQEDMTI